MKHCTFERADVPGTAVITVIGDFDYGECASFRTTCSQVSGAALVVDLSKCVYLDSSGLALLLVCRNTYARFALVTNESVQNVLSVTRLNGVLQTAETLEEALELVKS